jgi:hypothetical protein
MSQNSFISAALADFFDWSVKRLHMPPYSGVCMNQTQRQSVVGLAKASACFPKYRFIWSLQSGHMNYFEERRTLYAPCGEKA